MERTRTLQCFTLILLTFLFTACDGGGSGGEPRPRKDGDTVIPITQPATQSSNSPIEENSPVKSHTSESVEEDRESLLLHGSAIEGPLAHATVIVYSLDTAQPGLKGEKIVEGSTDQFGKLVDIVVPPPFRPVYLVEVDSNDHTIDLSTGKPPVLPTLFTLVLADQLQSPIYITPLTTLAVEILLQRVNATDDTTTIMNQFAAAISLTRQYLGFGLGEFNYLTDSPVIFADVSVDQLKTIVQHRTAIAALMAIAGQLLSDPTFALTADDLLTNLAALLIELDSQAGELQLSNKELLTAIERYHLAALPIPNTDKDGNPETFDPFTVDEVELLLMQEAQQLNVDADTSALAAGAVNAVPLPVGQDSDQDGVPDLADNCSAIKNPQQEDSDQDHRGDLCDEEDGNKNLPNQHDDLPSEGTTGSDQTGEGSDNTGTDNTNSQNDNQDADDGQQTSGGSEPPSAIRIELSNTLFNVLTTEIVSLTAQAFNTHDEEITQQLIWLDTLTNATGSGGSFVVTDQQARSHVITVTINNAQYQPVVATATVVFTDVDSDNDGLLNAVENALGTSPTDADTDDDGISDGSEVKVYKTDPLRADTDSDGLPDAYELEHQFNPLLADSDTDVDGDGLKTLTELLQGTEPNNPDTDSDGLSDGEEVNIFRTNPLAMDTDDDAIPDRLEILASSDPLIADAELDSDGDGFTNYEEWFANSSLYNATFYPGGPQPVMLNTEDSYHTIALSLDGLSATFNEAEPRAARANIAVAPGSGWYYAEARRNTAVGNYGIGIGSSRASLAHEAGYDSESIGLTTDGRVLYDGTVEQNYIASATNEHYGLAVDYSGITPVVYLIVTGGDGYPLILNAVKLVDIHDELYIMVFGEAVGFRPLTLNAGDNPLSVPFHFPAHYELFTAGFRGAEFMGSGWGLNHLYSGVEQVVEKPVVKLQLDEHSGAGIRLSSDGLKATYSISQKLGVRANQGMIGKFRYYECHRLIAYELIRSLGFGCGLMTAYGRINPYVFTPEQPSMSVNSMRGIWRNLKMQQEYDESAEYYGFAVDYRAARPIVHVIIFDEVVRSMTLPDVFTPLYPFLYGNSQVHTGVNPGDWINEVNFGAKPLHYHVRNALENAGIDTSDFAAGWGEVNAAKDLQ